MIDLRPVYNALADGQQVLDELRKRLKLAERVETDWGLKAQHRAINLNNRLDFLRDHVGLMLWLSELVETESKAARREVKAFDAMWGGPKGEGEGDGARDE